MSYYVPAYDTEPVYAWWRPPRADASGYDVRVSYADCRTDEFLDGVRAVADVHLRTNTPATFFIVARLLDQPDFDLQCHSYTHADLIAISDDHAALHHELVDAKKHIEDVFSRPVLGLTAPGGYTHGFSGQPHILDVMWEAGYRYMRTYGAGPSETVPAPLHQPFWYAEEGHPDLLEIPSHAWHDNILTGQPGLVHWPPVLPWDYPQKIPTDARSVYHAYAPGIDHTCDADLLTYIPIFHPWSIHRIDEEARQIEMLLHHARGRQDIASCTQVYNFLCCHRDRVPGHGPLST